jgi:hypothetical protein
MVEKCAHFRTDIPFLLFAIHNPVLHLSTALAVLWLANAVLNAEVDYRH